MNMPSLDDTRIKGLTAWKPPCAESPFRKQSLSGGQQQQVALARTLVYRPRLLLLDEPLSNLDAKLRERARVCLKELLSRLSMTTLYVTHDQDEALAMSDRILVVQLGEVIQDAKHERIYRNLSDQFVADFVGSSNFLAAVASERGDGFILSSGQKITATFPPGLGPGARLKIGFRTEDVEVSGTDVSPRTGEIVVAGDVNSVSYLGSKYEIGLNVLGHEIRIHAKKPVAMGSISLRTSSWMIFPAAENHCDSSPHPQVRNAP